MSYFWRTCLLFLLVAFVGCGDGIKVVPVSGIATYKGKPIPRLIITFTPPTGRPSAGMTDAEGRFELNYEEDRKGAQVATHTITVEYRPGDPGEEMDILEGKKKRPPAIDAIIKKYQDGKQNLTVEIKQATKDLDLKLD
jgi:hypothetical protein